MNHRRVTGCPEADYRPEARAAQRGIKAEARVAAGAEARDAGL